MDDFGTDDLFNVLDDPPAKTISTKEAPLKATEMMKVIEDESGTKKKRGIDEMDVSNYLSKVERESGWAEKKHSDFRD